MLYFETDGDPPPKKLNTEFLSHFALFKARRKD